MLLKLLTLLSKSTNSFFEKHPVVARLACIYFDITSRITHFLLFNFIIYSTLYILGVYMISVHFTEIQCFLHKVRLSDWKSFFFSLSRMFKFSNIMYILFFFLFIRYCLCKYYTGLYSNYKSIYEE